MKKKIIAYTSILLVILGVFAFNFARVKADSGWDSDFDSGGWDSSDSWSSSDSWDSDSSYSGGGGEGSADFGTVLFIIIVIIIIFAVFGNKNNKGGGGTRPNATQGNRNINKTISEEQVKKYIADFNKDKFLDEAYDKFVKVQNSWSDFNYDALRKLLTDELYNTYHSQLVPLKAKKQKNEMNGFEKQNIDITDMKVDGDKISLTVALVVSFYDYVIDKDEKVLRGTKDYKLTNSYNLTFISTINDKKEKDKKVCPSCGAPLENDVSNKCPYCNSNIVFKHHDWVLSKKEIRR